MHAPKAWRARLVSPLLLAISPWLTCHTHNVRTFAQLLTHALLVRYPPEEGLWKHQPGEADRRTHTHIHVYTEPGATIGYSALGACCVRCCTSVLSMQVT